MTGIIGYRTWVVEDKPKKNEGRLRSTAARYIWQPGENIAQCAKDLSGKKQRKPCKEGICESLWSHCGLWAYDSPESAYSRGHGTASSVLGVVLGYGKMIVGEFGWRAEKSKILALAHGWRTDLDSIADFYKVPLVPINKLDWIFEQHNGIQLKDMPEAWRLKKVDSGGSSDMAGSMMSSLYAQMQYYGTLTTYPPAVTTQYYPNTIWSSYYIGNLNALYNQYGQIPMSNTYPPTPPTPRTGPGSLSSVTVTDVSTMNQKKSMMIDARCSCGNSFSLTMFQDDIKTTNVACNCGANYSAKDLGVA